MINNYFQAVFLLLWGFILQILAYYRLARFVILFFIGLLNMMSNELLAAIKRRKKQMGGEQEQQSPTAITPPQSEPVVHSKGFNANKAKLQAFFAHKGEPEPAVEVPKQQLKGDPKSFNNAKALLEKQFGNKGGSTMNVANKLPPPPSIGGLPPPPPPPPPGNLPPPPPGNLPPPPPPPANLPPPPPPPPLNMSPPLTIKPNLPPPPPPAKSSLPPPPSTPSAKSNLPPPPPPGSVSPPPQQKSSLPSPNLPPPPPPYQSSIPSPVSNLPPPPPPPSNLSSQSSSHSPSPAHHNLPPPVQHQPPPVQQQKDEQRPAKKRIFTEQTSKAPHITFSHDPPAKQQSRTRAKPVDPENCFKISEGTKQTSEIPKVTGWTDKELEKNKRKKIFSKGDNKRYPLTQEVLGKNVAGLIKQQFLKTVDINKVIGLQVHKNQYEFHFPSIQHGKRQVEPIETLYADTNMLDLVSCFMNKNPAIEKPHKDQRDIVVTGFQDYNWEEDKLKLKLIKEAAQVLPDSDFQEPNFISIKNATSRTQSLIQTCVQSHDYARCDQLQRIIKKTEQCLKQYCQDPQNNKALLSDLQGYVATMKELSI